MSLNNMLFYILCHKKLYKYCYILNLFDGKDLKVSVILFPSTVCWEMRKVLEDKELQVSRSGTVGICMACNL